MTYLDYNATAPVRPEVIAAMTEALAHIANPSSMHRLGREAKRMLEDARATLADALSVWPNEVIFTASGSESNNLALRALPDRPLLVGATEHASVLKLAERLGGDTLPVDANGLIQLDILEAKLQALGRPAFVSIMLANNETGVIQSLDKISQITKAHNAILHTDAVQALGKIPLDFGALGVDMMSLSAHKCGGPVGAGALIVRNDLAIKSLIIGGGQELGRRAGTENLPAIIGFAHAAASGAKRDWTKATQEALTAMENDICRIAPDALIAGAGAPRLPNTSCIIMLGIASETQLMNFDLEGFCVSAGSACSSGRIEPSHVLRAMGISERDAESAIRVSVGWQSSTAEIQSFTDIWKKTYMRLAQKAA